MATNSGLTPYFQRRYVCINCGYFDVRSEKWPPDAVKCPKCKKNAFPRDGYECSGRTLDQLPHISKPRLEESTIYEFPEISEKGFRQARTKTRRSRQN